MLLKVTIQVPIASDSWLTNKSFNNTNKKLKKLLNKKDHKNITKDVRIGRQPNECSE